MAAFTVGKFDGPEAGRSGPPSFFQAVPGATGWCRSSTTPPSPWPEGARKPRTHEGHEGAVAQQRLGRPVGEVRERSVSLF